MFITISMGGRGKGEYFEGCENRKEMSWLITMVENEKEIGKVCVREKGKEEG